MPVVLFLVQVRSIMGSRTAAIALTKPLLHPLLLLRLTAAAQLDENVEVSDVTKVHDHHAEISNGARARFMSIDPLHAAKAARIVHDTNVLDIRNKPLAIENPPGRTVPAQVGAPFLIEDEDHEILILADAFLGAVGQVVE